MAKGGRKDIRGFRKLLMDILGVRVDNVDMEEAISRITAMVEDDRPYYVVTPNAEFLVDAQKDLEFKKILNSAELSIPDGMGLVFASRLYGKPLSERVTGTDLVENLCRVASKKGWSVFFLGGFCGVGKKSAESLSNECGDLSVLGYYEGSREEEADYETLEQINSIVKGRRADILFVAFGHKYQEKWIARNLDDLNISVAIGVGGAFDFISGCVPRAPLWMRRSGLEWLFRVFKQPWRWRRILKAVVVFPVLVLREKIFG